MIVKRYNVAKLLMCLSIFLVSCNLYEKTERPLSSFSTTDGAKISIYYVDMGATTKEVIQVRSNKVYQNNGVIANFDKNCLQESKLLNDSTLFLVLKDSGSVKRDTEWVKIGNGLK